MVHGSQVTVDHVGWPYRPEGLTSAQLNLPFCVATLLLEGDVFVDQFEPEAFTDPARMELSQEGRGRARSRHHRARLQVPAQGAASRCILRDGTVERETREPPRGGEDAFAPAADIIEKFKKLSRATMSEARQAGLIDMILDMENMPDMRRLPEALRAE